jgi:hypothetical protein
MPLHKIFRGDKAEAVKLLPFALNKLKSLKELLGLDSWSQVIHVGRDRKIRLSVVGEEETVKIWAAFDALYWCRDVQLSGTLAALQAQKLKLDLQAEAIAFKDVVRYNYTGNPADDYDKRYATSASQFVAAVIHKPSTTATFYKLPLKTTGRVEPITSSFFQFTYSGNYVSFFYKDRFGLAYGTLPTLTLRLWNYQGVQIQNSTLTVDTTPPVGYYDASVSIIQGTHGHFYVTSILYKVVTGGAQVELRITRRHISAPDVVVTTYTPILIEPVLDGGNRDITAEFVADIYERGGLLFVSWAKRLFQSPGSGSNFDSDYVYDLYVLDTTTGTLRGTFLNSLARRLLYDGGSNLYALGMPSVTFEYQAVTFNRTKAFVTYSLELYSLNREDEQVILIHRRQIAQSLLTILTGDAPSLPANTIDTTNRFALHDG